MALFDGAGAHPPTHRGGWIHDSRALDEALVGEFASWGLTVVDDPAELPITRPSKGQA